MVIRFLMVSLAAFLVSFLVAPWGHWYLHWIAYLPMFWALREETPRANRWLVFWYGTLAEAFIFSWIADTITLFSNLPMPVAWIILLLFSVVFGLPYFFAFAWVHQMRRRFGDWWMIVLPSWLVVVEWIGSWIILFPYNQGVSQFQFLPVWQLTSITGVWGLSWLVLFFNTTLAEAMYRRREGRPFPVPWFSAAVAVVSLIVIWGNGRIQRIEKELQQVEPTRVAQIQDDVTMVERRGKSREAFEFWMESTKAFPRGSVDLVVWPEGASPYSLNGSTAAVLLWELVERGDFDLVVGGGTRERSSDPEMGETGRVLSFNSVYYFGREQLAGVPGASLEADVQAWIDDGCPAGAFAEDAEVVRVAVHQLASQWALAGTCVDNLPVLREEVHAARDTLARALVADDALYGRYLTARRQVGPMVEGRLKMDRRRGPYLIAIAEGCDSGDCPGFYFTCDLDQECELFPAPPHYDKMVPLPFGEYLPGAQTFPWIADLIEGPGNFRAGTEAVVFESNGGRLATPICYEAILGYVCDEYEAPDLFVNVTNDAWFGDTAASALHGMLVAIRAVELGTPVFRSAYSGLSFVVEPHGRIHAQTELFEEAHRMVPVRVKTFDTLFAKWGSWWVWVSALVCALAWWRTRQRAADSASAAG